MAYTPTTWKSGDIVTSAKLNKLETAAAPYVVTFTLDYEDDPPSATADKTLAEIETAWNAGMVIYFDVDGYTIPASRKYDGESASWIATGTEYQAQYLTVTQGIVDADGAYYLWGEYTMTSG